MSVLASRPTVHSDGVKNKEEEKKDFSLIPILCETRLQVFLAMARNLSIGTRCKKDSEGEKRAKKG